MSFFIHTIADILLMRQKYAWQTTGVIQYDRENVVSWNSELTFCLLPADQQSLLQCDHNETAGRIQCYTTELGLTPLSPADHV